MWSSQQWLQEIAIETQDWENIFNLITSIVPADGTATLGDKTSAGNDQFWFVYIQHWHLKG